MKKSAIFTLLIYCLTLTAPARSHAAIPLAFLAAGAIGASLLAASGGTYYTNNAGSPKYVPASSSATPSASDYIFQPAYLAAGPYVMITAASFPGQITTYIGKEAAVGTTLDKVWQSVKANPSAFPDFSEVFADATPPAEAIADTTQITSGTPLILPANDDGTVYQITPTGVWNLRFQNRLADERTQLSPPISGTYSDGNNGGLFYVSNASGATQLHHWQYSTTVDNKRYYNEFVMWAAGTLVDTDQPQTFPPGPTLPDFDSIKNALDNRLPTDAALADEARQLIKNNPLVAAQSVPAAGAGTAPSALTPAEIAAFQAANAAAVAAKAAQTAAEIAAANPTDAAAQIAALQAAVEAAKASSNVSSEAAEKEDYTASRPALTIPARKSVSFQPIIDARTLTMSKAPFTWFGTLPGILHGLVASPSPPNFTIDLGILQQKIDLAFLDPFAATCRSIVAFFMYLMTVFLMIKIFRSM